MTRRGYFENQSGKFRLRIVEEGYDADDPNVPGNKVVIDSDAIGTLSVLQSGMYTANNASQLSGQWIVSGWGLPYIPLCTFLFQTADNNYWMPYAIIAGTTDLLRVTSDGIYVNMTDGFGLRAFPFRIRWVAYRIPVTP